MTLVLCKCDVIRTITAVYWVSQSERQLNVTQRVTAGLSVTRPWDRYVRHVEVFPSRQKSQRRERKMVFRRPWGAVESGERSMSTVAVAVAAAAGRGDTSCFDAPFVSALYSPHRSTIPLAINFSSTPLTVGRQM